VSIVRVSVDGPGFSISRPSLPFPIAPGSAQDTLLSFTGSAPILYTGNLQVNSQLNSEITGIGVKLTAAVVTGPVLTIFPVCTGSDGPPPSIDFGRVQAGQVRLCNFSLQNPTAQEMTIGTFQVSGAAFQLSTGLKAPFKIAAGSTVAFVINFTPAAAAVYSGALAIATRTYALSGAGFSAPLPKPVLEFDAGPMLSSQQRRLTMRLPSVAPATTSGFVNLALLPDTTVVTDDPAVMFLATGSRSMPFSVSAGSTQVLIGGQASALFQTGTTAGRIRFTLTGVVTEGDATVFVPIPPSLTSVDTVIASRRTQNLLIQVTGFDNTYTAGAMTFTFLDASGNAIQPAIGADFTQDFRAFFIQAKAGSAFKMQISFPVNGDTAGIGSVDLKLTSSAGTTSTHVTFQ
jgi:hypothetical protein